MAAAISRMCGSPQRRVVVPQVFRMSLWLKTNMLDSDRRYASTWSDSTIESTLQLTTSSISFQISADTAFKPSLAAPGGSSLGDGANQTSRSFSGPAKVSWGFFCVMDGVHTFKCIARVEIDSSFMINRQLWCTLR